MAIAAGTCPNCGHSEKRVLKEGRARTIFTCPECQNGRIIARKIKMESPNGEKEKEGDSGDEGTGGRTEGEKEKAKGDAPTKNEKTDGKSARKVSTVRKVTYAKREPKSDANGDVPGKKSATGGGSTGTKASRKASPDSKDRPPTTRKPTGKQKRPQDQPAETTEDWRSLYAHIY